MAKVFVVLLQNSNAANVRLQACFGLFANKVKEAIGPLTALIDSVCYKFRVLAQGHMSETDS